MKPKLTLLIALLFSLQAIPALATPTAATEALAGLTRLDGQAAGYQPQKRATLVVFWATWCEDCRAKLKHELPELAKREDLDLITVNSDQSRERAQEYVQREKVSLPVFRDESKALRRSLQIFSVPHWALYRRTPEGLQLVTSAAAFQTPDVLNALKGI